VFLQIANAERLAMEAAARVFEPPPVVDYVEWAKDNIVFSERESPFPGPFNVERFPHVAPILAALSPEDPCRVVTNALAVDGTAQPAGTAEAAVAAAWDRVVDGLNSKS
jgi:hypothetical protein